jgi:hypothetical protein
MRAVRKSADYSCMSLQSGSGNERKIKGSQYESCFTDNFGNCGQFSRCSHCDFRQRCKFVDTTAGLSENGTENALPMPFKS